MDMLKSARSPNKFPQKRILFFHFSWFRSNSPFHRIHFKNTFAKLPILKFSWMSLTHARMHDFSDTNHIMFAQISNSKLPFWVTKLLLFSAPYKFWFATELNRKWINGNMVLICVCAVRARSRVYLFDWYLWKQQDQEHVLRIYNVRWASFDKVFHFNAI